MSRIFWAQPEALWLLPLPLLWMLLGRWRRRSKQRFADAALWRWVFPMERRAGQYGALLFLFLVWLLLLLALAGPRVLLAQPMQAIPEGAGDEDPILVVLDRSPSMRVPDAGANGGARVQHAVDFLLTGGRLPLRRPLGLIVFSGGAHLLFPPTQDAAFIEDVLRSLDALPQPSIGNDLASALHRALEQLAQKEGHRSLWIFTDGDYGAETQAALLDSFSAKNFSGLDVQVVGLGQGIAQPIPDGSGGWLRQHGRPITSARQDAWLRQWAAQIGGGYVSGDALQETLLEHWMLDLERVPQELQAAMEWLQLAPYLTAAALLIYLLLLPASWRALSGLIFMVLGAFISPASQASGELQAAIDAADWPRVEGLAKDLSGSAGRFAHGVACYQQQKWGCAAAEFSLAAWQAEDDSQRARAAFNLAATRFQQGDFSAALTLYQDAQGLGLWRPELSGLIQLVSDLDAAVKRHLQQRAAMQARSGRALAGNAEPSELASSGRYLAHDSDAPPPLEKLQMDAQMEVLIARGVEHVRLRQASVPMDSLTRAPFKSEAVPLSQERIAIWVRALELSEGFPAPVQTPQVRPGAQAW